MSRQSTFQRKIIYLVGICILLGLLVLSSSDLTQRREEHGLSQAHLGQMDPTSETIKLATLGMRGIAANILWEKAYRYQMKKDWTNLSATLEQITRVQPNFISVWRFQAWNLSYNVSVQFDNFRDRYQWVIRGIDFLQKGVAYNEREPRLVSEVGWFTSHKIGRADEHRQFRKLFKEDDDFHGRTWPYAVGEDRDNWLVGKHWFRRAEELIETTGVAMTGKSPLMLYSDAPMCQISYAEALEKDGRFDEKAKVEWEIASKEWSDFGDREIATSYEDVPFVRLNDLELRQEEASKLFKELEPLLATRHDQIEQEKRAELTAEQRQVLEIPSSERTAEQQQLAEEAEQQIKVTNEEVARRLDGADRTKAIDLIKRMAAKQRVAKVIGRYRDPVNFDYWQLRANIEQDDLTLSARKLIYDGSQAFADGDLEPARKLYDRGLQAWREVLDKYPRLIAEWTIRAELTDTVDVYRRLLDLRDEEFPDPFILQDIFTPPRSEQ